MEGTMEFNINGRNLSVSDRFREYAEEKISKIEQLGDKVQRLDAKITKELNARQADSSMTVELTVLGRGPVVRAEASAADKFAAFDLAYGKLMERLRRARDRRKVHHGRHNPKAVHEATASLEPASTTKPLHVETSEANLNGSTPSAQADESSAYEIENDIPAGDSPVLIRRKVFPAPPMTLDDAVDNMELVGHDFYLFIDSATNSPSVVYRRRGWTYGVISLDANCNEESTAKEELLAYRAAEGVNV
jgi:ribosomal subunit interface protein